MRNSKIILCHNINLDRDYVNVLDYTENQMLALCNSNKVAESNTFSFIRQSRNRIATSFDYSVVLQSNYIAFQNPDYSNKWFFAFVDDVIWKGEKNTEIVFTVDSWSTWFHETSVKSCFVSREHVNDDTIGLHTIPEDIDIGDVVCDSINRTQDMSAFGYIGVMTSYIPYEVGVSKHLTGSIVNRNIFGSEILLFNIDSNLTDFKAYISRANQDAKIEEIHNIFFIPFQAIDLSKVYQSPFEYGEQGGLTVTFNILRMLDSTTPFIENITFDKPLSFQNYTPKNNKLKCYPYNYLTISNNNGEENILKIEDFSGNQITFRNEFAITIGGSGRLIPLNYRGLAEDIDNSIALGKLPTFEWNVDSYTNWLTQNAVNNQIDITNMTINAISQGLTGNIVGAVGTIANQTLESYSKFYSAKLLPNKVAGNNTGDVSFSNKETNYLIRRFRPKNEYLQIIDDYFTRFRL